MNEHRLTIKLMGSAFELIVAHDHPQEAKRILDAGVEEISRIEDLLSEFREYTVVSQINQNAGIKGVRVNKEVFRLMQRCRKISELTQGAFDITVGPLKKIYQFKNNTFEFPDNEIIQKTLQKVGFDKISMDEETLEIFLALPGMHISFAAIGKGYAADCVKKIWMKEGVTSGVISASGDLTTIGHRADGSSWKIGIADPDDRTKMSCFIPVINASVATSGDYEQFFMHGGIRYSHNLNPLTGRPLSGIKSVSVISPAAELSDALATAVYVMGAEAGFHLINQLPDTHCILTDDKNQSFYSKKIELYHEKNAAGAA